VNYYLQSNPRKADGTNWSKDEQADVTGIAGRVSFQQYITRSERNTFMQMVETKYAEWAQPAENPVRAYSNAACN
jgi:hypothetical protein